MSEQELPLIDIAGHRAGDPAASIEAAKQVREALENVGFLSVVGHGIPWDQVDEIYQWATRYHALPSEAKTDHAMGPENMGYITMGESRHGELPDLNAAFFMGRPGSRRNRFPASSVLPGFTEGITGYYGVMAELGQDLLALYALALDMPAEYFEQFFDPALATLRMSHYPAVESLAGQWGIGSHSDAGFATLLPCNPVSGLEIETTSGDWISVHQEPESFVVNAGDTLRRWSNDRFLSTNHRVRADPLVERYAIPFFYDPRVDSVIDPLPTCIDEDHPRLYEPLVYRDHLSAFMREGYEATRPGSQGRRGFG